MKLFLTFVTIISISKAYPPEANTHGGGWDQNKGHRQPQGANTHGDRWDQSKGHPQSQGASRGQGDPAIAARRLADKNAKIIKMESENTGHQYHYAYETDNGISAHEAGRVNDGTQAHGAYSYTGDEGEKYAVSYTADKDGFRPSGNHLPTPQTLPAEIANSLEQNAADEEYSYGAKRYPKEGHPHPQGTSRGQVDPATTARRLADKNAKIINMQSENTGHQYHYAFETDNGISAHEAGTVSDGTQAHGAYSYTGEKGEKYAVSYTADKDGFRPSGNHLPTPQPLPAEIAKSLEQNAADEAKGIYDDGSYRHHQHTQDESHGNQYSHESHVTLNPHKGHVTQHPHKSHVTQHYGAATNDVHPHGDKSVVHGKHQAAKSAYHNY